MGEKKITDKILEDLLGKPPTAAIAALVEAIANNDAAAAITALRQTPQRRHGRRTGPLRNHRVPPQPHDRHHLRRQNRPPRCPHRIPRRASPPSPPSSDAPTTVHLIALCEQTLQRVEILDHAPPPLRRPHRETRPSKRPIQFPQKTSSPTALPSSPTASQKK